MADQTNKTDQSSKPDKVEYPMRDSRAHLMGIITSAMDAIITINESQQIILFNSAAEKMFGYQAESAIGQPIDILLPEQFRERHQKHIHRFSETGETNRTMGRLGRLFGQRSGGGQFPIEASISQINTTNGKLFTVILRDITEKVKAEDQLMENEQNLRATFEQAAIGISHVSPEGRFIRVNQRLCEITGYNREELLEKSFQEITYPEDLELDMKMHNQVARGEIQSYVREKRYVKKDGTIVWVNLSGSAVRDLTGSTRYLVKVFEDITERKKSEEALRASTEEIKSMTQQLWQTARLATMGELSASIAHELNNPLAIISLRIESLQASTPQDSPESHELDIISQETERMASLVANLLQFSRSKEQQISTLDVREEADRTLELIHNHLVHRQVNIVRDYSPDIPLVLADRQQLRQLFLNLFANASDAMPGGGSLKIRIQPASKANHIHIEVADTGLGISAKHLQKVMEPFYTTKEDGKGTGLGLAICRRIVEEHNGSIVISSPGENQGTTVEIILPSTKENRVVIIE